MASIRIRHGGAISRRLFPSSAISGQNLGINLHRDNHVIIGGFGRRRAMLADSLEKNGTPHVAIERNIDFVEKYRKRGKNGVYGDSNNVEILGLCHLASAKPVVLTFKSIEEDKAAITRIRQTNADVPMVVWCQTHSHYDGLISLGANHVFPELLESSLLVVRHLLELLEVSEDEIETQINDYLRSLPANIRQCSKPN